MRLTRPRFTVRRLMVAVAISAISIQGWILWQRSSAIAKIVWKHERELWLHQYNRETVHERRSPGIPDDGKIVSPVEVEEKALLDRLAMNEERLVWKYRRAMWCPWLSVEPDPPEPE